MAIRKARDQGKHISYFGPEANDFGLLEQTFVDYGRHGKGQSRKYLHTYDRSRAVESGAGDLYPLAAAAGADRRAVL